MDDEKLAFVKKMIEGDERAFDGLYHSYSGKLYRMAYFITGNKSDSEDVLQETFVKCFLHRKTLKEPERFEAWICQILVRTAWKQERRSGKSKEVSYEGILELGEESGSRTAQQMQEDAASPGPLDQLLKKEQSGELMRAVQGLDVKYRTIVLLYYYNELGIREIAQITGLFEGTVKSRLSKARKLLKGALVKEGDPPGQSGPLGASTGSRRSAGPADTTGFGIRMAPGKGVPKAT